MTLPNLVIAGVNKAGTTTLFGALARHPDVAGSDVKETCHWLPLRYDEPQPGVDVYEQHFREAGGAGVVMEATPGYFYGGDRIAPALAAAVPGVKVVVVLREPISRLRSFFRFQKAMLTLDADLDADTYVAQCLEHDRDALVHDRALNPWFGVEGGRYDVYLPAWVDAFGDRLRVIAFDDLAGDQAGVLSSLAAWLGIDPTAWDDLDLGADNKTVAPKNRALHRVAIEVNRRFETQLRRAPALKSAVRSLYGRVNAGAAVDDFSPATTEQLEALYAPHNRHLGSQWRALGDTPPPWAS